MCDGTTGPGTVGSSVLVDRRLSSSKQCEAGGNKANIILEHIKKGICLQDKSILLPLYRTLFLPRLEYSSFLVTN